MTSGSSPDARQAAIARLERKRGFQMHLAVYLVVNTLLIGIWAVTGMNMLFWPAFPLLGWGIGIAFNGWAVYRGELSEDDIQREMTRGR